MNRIPSKKKTGHPGQVPPKREGVGQAPGKPSASRPSVLPALKVYPRAPPPDDVRPKRQSTEARRLRARNLQPLAYVPVGLPVAPAGAIGINSSLSGLAGSGTRSRRRKELSFVEVLQRHNLLPKSRPSSPERPFPPDGRPASPKPTRPDMHSNKPTFVSQPQLRPVPPTNPVPGGHRRRRVRPTRHAVPQKPLCPDQPPPAACSNPVGQEELALTDSRFSQVFVLSWTNTGQPVETTSKKQNNSIDEPKSRRAPTEHKGPLLARRAQRNAPKVVEVAPVASPRLLPALAPGKVSMVTANVWDQPPKKTKRFRKASRLHDELLRKRQGLAEAEAYDRMALSAIPSGHNTVIPEHELVIEDLKSTPDMCPMFSPQDVCGKRRRISVDNLKNVPFKMWRRAQVVFWERRVMLK